MTSGVLCLEDFIYDAGHSPSQLGDDVLCSSHVHLGETVTVYKKINRLDFTDGSSGKVKSSIGFSIMHLLCRPGRN